MNWLIVNPELPQFDRTSGGLRLQTFIGLLREQGCACRYLVTTPEAERRRIGDADWARYCSALKDLGVEVLTLPLQEALELHQPDVVMFEFFHVARPFLRTVRAMTPRARVVVDSVDLNFLRYHAKADLSGLPEDRAKARQVEEHELETYRRSELVLTLTDDEAGELNRRLPGVATFNLPNIHPLPDVDRREETTPEVLFIGSFTHDPNVDAVRWFRDDVWPRVRAARPDARWTIIGANAPEDISALTGDGIVFEGRVPLTDPYMRRAWVSIAPLRFGAGMKGKVGEALAWGVPVVTTSFGAQGYGIESGCSGMLADTADSFADAVLALMSNAPQRMELGSNGRSLIAGRFTREAVAASLPGMLTHLEQSRIVDKVACPMLARLELRTSSWWAKNMAWRLR